MKELKAEFWEEKYVEQTWGWDIGYPSPALIEYAEKQIPKDARILIPGCGHAYEGQWLFENGWTNVTLTDLSETAKKNFLERVPHFPADQYQTGDFFALKGPYDYILEQTFYCALPPTYRDNYVGKMKELLSEGGRLAGVLFTFPLTEVGPPYGGSMEEYEKRFSGPFTILHLEECRNSIAPRSGKEAFIQVEKTV